MSSKKQEYSLEFPIRCSPTILFEFLSTAVGLTEWFADKVDSKEDKFFFTWNGSVDTAYKIEELENEYVVYRWDYYDENEFFEFRIEQSPVTNETILTITDFADKYDIEGAQQLWESQVSDLKHRVGS